MASTNKTTHYNLSQYSASDKPTYLIDYNTDMSNIDTGIYNAQTTANESSSAIGTLSNLNTTDKSSLVNAINEVNTQVGTNTGNIGTLQTNVAANTGNIGTMANLTTSNKTSLVNAVNEINEIINKFNFVNFIDLSNNTITTTSVNGSITRKNIKIATNNDYSIIKLYGSIGYTADGYTSTISIANAIPSGYRPSSDIVVNSCGVVTSNGASAYALNCDVTFKVDGSILITAENGGWDPSVSIQLVPCLIFLKDFGDVPTPPSN